MRVLTVVFGVLLLGACEAMTGADYVARAEQALSEGKLQGARIDLVSALQVNPDNVRARYLLGDVYLRQGNWLAAEKELRRARDLGVEANSVVPGLALALRAQGRNEEVIAFSVAASASASIKADLATTQALAYLSLGNPEKAEDVLREALELAPEGPYPLTTKAAFLIRTGELEEAKRLLIEVTVVNPMYPKAWSLLGRLELQAGNFTAADEMFTKAIDNASVEPRDHFNRAIARISMQSFEKAQPDIDFLRQRKIPFGDFAQGLALFAQEQYSDALDAFSEALNELPDNLAVNLFTALCQIQLEHWGQAEALTESVVYRLSPDSVMGRKLLAFLRLRRGQFDDVEDLLRPITESGVDDAVVNRLMSVALFKLGKTDEAIEFLKNDAEKQPDAAVARLRLGAAMLENNRVAEAIDQLSLSIAEVQDFSEANVLLALTYLRSADYDAAEAVARKYLAVSEGSAHAETLLGLVLTAKGDKNGAVQALRRADGLSPGDIGANTLLGMLAAEGNDYQEARSRYLKILEYQNGRHLPTLLRLSQLEERAGRPDEAEHLLKEATVAYPAAVMPRIYLARLRVHQGKPKDAVQLLEPMAKGAAKNRKFLGVYGDALRLSGRKAEAKDVMEQLASLSPNSSVASYLLAHARAAIGDVAGAKSALETALRIEPDFFRARMAYTKLLVIEGDFRRAQESLAALRAAAPDDPTVKLLEFAMANSAEKPDVAPEHFEVAFETLPASETTLLLARQYWAAGRRSEARLTLEEWVRQHPDDVTVRFALAQFYRTNERQEDAVSEYEAILARDPNNVLAMNEMAWVLRDSDPARGLDWAESAVSMAPDAIAVLDTLALLQAKNRQFDQAMQTLEKAFHVESDNPTLMFRKAQVLAMAGNGQEASAILTSLLEKPDEFPERNEAEALSMELRSAR